MSPKRVAVALLIVGVVLLPGPAYAIGLDNITGEERHRSSAGYVATPIDAENDSVLAEGYANEVSLRTQAFKYRHVAEEYRAPNETRRVLEKAIRDGTATTSSSAVEADVRQLQRNHTLLTQEYDAYYTYSVSSSDGSTTIETSRANDSEIAAIVREERIVDYEDLSENEQATVRKIRNATESEQQYDYRPWSDEPIPEQPIVHWNGTYYAIEVASHTDDINFPPGFFLGFVASGVGILSLLGAAIAGLYSVLRDSSDESAT